METIYIFNQKRFDLSLGKAISEKTFWDVVSTGIMVGRYNNYPCHSWLPSPAWVIKKLLKRGLFPKKQVMIYYNAYYEQSNYQNQIDESYADDAQKMQLARHQACVNEAMASAYACGGFTK